MDSMRLIFGGCKKTHLNSLRDDIKSSGKFAIFTRRKIEGGVGQRHIMEKLPLKIQIVEDIDEDIDVKMTQSD